MNKENHTLNFINGYKIKQMRNKNKILILLLVLLVSNILLAQTQHAIVIKEDSGGKLSEEKPMVAFGICTDVHQDIIFDGEKRLTVFVNDMKAKKADFIIQLGDFCTPQPDNDSFISVFQQFGDSAYSVIGNHDRDNGATKEAVISYFKMPAAYYSFDKKGIHFIVMDGNEKGMAGDGYPLGISDEQKKWVENDLNNTDKKTVLFIHQSLVYDIDDKEIIDFFSSQKLSDGSKKVIACFNGHKHTDRVEHINGIWYVTINSMSDIWMGKEYKHKIKGIKKKVYREKPELKYVCPYVDPLYAFVKIYQDGTITVKGKTSTWMKPTPKDLGFPLDDWQKPEISDRTLKQNQLNSREKTIINKKL